MLVLTMLACSATSSSEFAIAKKQKSNLSKAESRKALQSFLWLL